MPPPDPQGFLAQCQSLGIELEPHEVDRLARFLGMMLEANKTTNLTSITEPAQAWSRHILDALSLIPVLASIEAVDAPPPEAIGEVPLASASPSAAGPTLVIDIGSGGGVPALPLAIAMPGHRFMLVEATGKKARFLQSVISALNLTNARVREARAEVLGHIRPTGKGGSSSLETFREQYDVAMARALGHLAVVCELCAPLVRPGGLVVAVKGEKADQELAESAKAMGLLGLRHVQTIVTPTGRLVLLEKTMRTPKTYPRRAGEPARVPLGVERPSAGK